MKKFQVLLIVCLMMVFSATVQADHHESMDENMKGSAGGEMSEEEQAMMAKWQEYATPNENHKVLGGIVGSWDHTVKWWMSKDAPAEESTGTSEITWIMDGRFIQEIVSGMSMGQPFTGMGITGYDNSAKEYNTIWLDSMGTGIMKGTGQYDPQTKTLTGQGIYSCPMKGGESTYRSVLKIVDADHYTYQMYSSRHVEGGEEFLNMEIQYTRKK